MTGCPSDMDEPITLTTLAEHAALDAAHAGHLDVRVDLDKVDPLSTAAMVAGVGSGVSFAMEDGITEDDMDEFARIVVVDAPGVFTAQTALVGALSMLDSVLVFDDSLTPRARGVLAGLQGLGLLPRDTCLDTDAEWCACSARNEDDTGCLVTCCCAGAALDLVAVCGCVPPRLREVAPAQDTALHALGELAWELTLESISAQRAAGTWTESVGEWFNARLTRTRLALLAAADGLPVKF